VLHFLRSLPLSRPRLIAVAMSDWIVALTIRDFVERHLRTAPESSVAEEVRQAP
jgi:hypothetical protein